MHPSWTTACAPAPIRVAFAVGIVIDVPATMAINRDRSAVLWVIVSLLITPLLSILLLWMLGDS